MPTEAQTQQQIADLRRRRMGLNISPVKEDSYFANQPLSGMRIVKLVTGQRVDYPELAIPDDGDAILGLTVSAANTDQPIVVRSAGVIVDLTWVWPVGPVFCGPAGVLSQTPPDSGWTKQVGTVIQPTVMLVKLFPTYYRRP